MSFFDQLIHALGRMVTLPKSKNSLSDVLGKDVADVLTHTIHDTLAHAVTGALTQLAATAVKDVAHVQDFVTTTITHTLSGVSPALADEINGAVKTAISQAEAVALSSVAKITGDVLAEVSKVLKLS